MPYIIFTRMILFMKSYVIYLNEGKSDIGGVIRITNRQLEIVLYLNEIRKTTIQELADKFEVSKRTIMRDINRISSIGVPIHTQPGYQGGVSIPSTYKFQQSFFFLRMKLKIWFWLFIL